MSGGTVSLREWRDETVARFSSAEALMSFIGVWGKKSGNTYEMSCPFPDHEDGTASFHIYPDGTFCCFGACGRAGTIIDYVLGLKGWKFDGSRQENAKKMEEVLKIINGRGIDLPQKKEAVAPYTPHESETRDLNLPHNDYTIAISTLHQHPLIYKWLVDRVADPQILTEYRVGLNDGSIPEIQTPNGYPVKGITFPAWDDDHIYHVEVRATEKISWDRQKKYVSCGSYCYSYYEQIERGEDTVHVVETKRDALLIMSILGRKCAVAAPANQLGDARIAKLSKFRRIILWADHDPAGENTVKKYQEVWGRKYGKPGKLVVAEYPVIDGVKDIGDLWLLSAKDTRNIIQSTHNGGK